MRFANSTAWALILGLGLALTAHGQAGAQTDTAKLVTERQDAMKALASNLFGGVNRVVKGEAPVDTAAAPAETANQIAQTILARFPTGSGRDAVPATRARPEVWSDRAEFEAAARRLSDETAKLAAVAKLGDLEAIKVQFGLMARACGGCHEGPSAAGGKFRFPRQ